MRNKIKLLLSISVLSFFTSATVAAQKTPFRRDFVKDIELISSISSPWRNFHPEILHFAFGSNSSQDVFYYKFKKEDFDRVGVVANQELNSPDWFFGKLKDLPDVPNGIYAPQVQKPAGNSLEQLASAIRMSFIYLWAEPSLPGVSFTHEEIARIALHESFHMQYQFGGGFKNPSVNFDRTYLDKCALNKQWLRSITSEFSDEQSILAQWDSISDLDLKSKVLTIIKRRHADDSNVDQKFCWDATRYWERIEGTAYFVESIGAQRAGFITEPQLNIELAKYLLKTSSSVSAGTPPSQTGVKDLINPGFFYGTGALYSRVVSRLQPGSRYESLIENGLSPEESADDLLQTLQK